MIKIGEVYEWYALLPPDLIARAYNSDGELAWARSDALDVVALLESKGHPVIGVDTWLPTCPGPSVLIEDWDERSAMSASDFIAAFRRDDTAQSHSDVAPYFAIVA